MCGAKSATLSQRRQNVVTDPLFAPLASQFRAKIIRSIVAQLDAAKILPPDLDRQGEDFQNAVYNIAFFVLVQLEDSAGLLENGDRYFSHLVFTPKGESPDSTTNLVSQAGRVFLHGGLLDEEVAQIVSEYFGQDE